MCRAHALQALYAYALRWRLATAGVLAVHRARSAQGCRKHTLLGTMQSQLQFQCLTKPQCMCFNKQPPSHTYRSIHLYQ
ncbi:hypothetical protein COO60DRAFT_594984 [Scenedesmus sp. NREL 46B-D3]|nr:hypothetical protein COO60DRAFT_594984 [Scenedesmus sp. NREL 46B-D3]